MEFPSPSDQGRGDGSASQPRISLATATGKVVAATAQTLLRMQGTREGEPLTACPTHRKREIYGLGYHKNILIPV